mmetsp:Transcript_27681/g.64564  ORF Transcript_27681/g.64564 Transcript_27681/m.64564 type:complete len:216 (+) Transcript_27681:1036-1683(+)
MRGEDLHHPFAVHLIFLVERPEPDVLWWQCLIREGWLQRGEVMSADGHESPPPANVLVKFVLQVNEALVPVLIESHAPQHSAYDEGPDLCCGGMHRHVHLRYWLRLCQRVVRQLHVTSEDLQRPHEALQAEEIVTVCRHINLEDHALTQTAGCCLSTFSGHNVIIGRYIVELKAELKAKIAKTLLSHLPDGLFQHVLENAHSWHWPRPLLVPGLT